MDALRRIHAALVPGGVVVDTQPVSPRPPVESEGDRLGTLDMREWLETINAVDARVGEAAADGLFAVVDEQHFIVTDTYDAGEEFVETVSGWQGTRISRALAARATAAVPPIDLRQVVHLRVLRALPSR